MNLIDFEEDSKALAYILKQVMQFMRMTERQGFKLDITIDVKVADREVFKIAIRRADDVDYSASVGN